MLVVVLALPAPRPCPLRGEEIWKCECDVEGDVNEPEIFEVVVETSLALARLCRFEAAEDDDPEDA